MIVILIETDLVFVMASIQKEYVVWVKHNKLDTNYKFASARICFNSRIIQNWDMGTPFLVIKFDGNRIINFQEMSAD